MPNREKKTRQCLAFPNAVRFYSLPIKEKLVLVDTTPQAIDLYIYFIKNQYVFIYNKKIQMPVIKTLPRGEREELRDHRDNTMKNFVKAYTLRQLSFMDGIDTRTIKNSGKYIPVRIDSSETSYRFSKGLLKKPYMTRYIRLDEIKAIFTKRNKGKKLTIE